jgi:hypothetical protein
VPHTGDALGDRGHGVELLERPVNDFHDFVIIPREPVIDRLEAASIIFSAYPTVSIILSIILIFKIPPIIPPKQELPSQILVPSARIFR